MLIWGSLFNSHHQISSPYHRILIWGSLLNSRHPGPRRVWKGGSDLRLMTPDCRANGYPWANRDPRDCRMNSKWLDFVARLRTWEPLTHIERSEIPWYKLLDETWHGVLAWNKISLEIAWEGLIWKRGFCQFSEVRARLKQWNRKILKRIFLGCIFLGNMITR